MIKALVFDIGGTFHTSSFDPLSTALYQSLMLQCLEENGIRIEDGAKNLFERIEEGAAEYKKYAEQNLIELAGDRIWKEFMLKAYDVSDRELWGKGEKLSYIFDRYRKKLIKREGLGEVLEELKRRGYRLGVISNIMSLNFVPQILREYGIDHLFESIVLSSVCGIRKPNRKIFDLALKELEIGAEEACYIGDTISRDLLGARNAGWKTMIKIGNPAVSRKDREYESCNLREDFKIKELKEIFLALDFLKGEDKKNRG
ncbi:MAG: HAD family hydrolase [Johnsonella sp.]|nr:HAD family hydrolase [Johnsonella sp.]